MLPDYLIINKATRVSVDGVIYKRYFLAWDILREVAYGDYMNSCDTRDYEDCGNLYISQYKVESR